MDKNAIKKYAVWARRELIERVSQRAMIYGITAKDAGDPNAESVNGHLLSQAEKRQRQALIRNIKTKGYEQVMEEVAYTWFNRFAALRFMEVNGYLPSHIRVFTNDAGEFKPQILAEAIHLELEGLDMNKVYELENANKSEELFKYLLIVQCNALNSILPGMFQRIEDYTELLLPDYLLREGSVIEQMVTTIPEENWTDQVQIIGWLYQYYNTEPKEKVFAAQKKGSKVSKENIPAATQLFTPDWIVRYMVENSLGRLWLEGHPNDALKSDWKYYLDEAEQEPEVQAQLATIRKEYAALKPEEIRVIDPCMGSGHILCVLFDVLVSIYEDYGYTAREAAVKIVENNLWGLDIDERAAQLSYFAVMMKARQYDRRFFTRKIQPHVHSIYETNTIKDDYDHAKNDFGLSKENQEILDYLICAFIDAKEYGSILQLENRDYMGLKAAWEKASSSGKDGANLSLWYTVVAPEIPQLIEQAIALAQKYDVIVTNPPYLSFNNMSPNLVGFVKDNYADCKIDLYACCMKKNSTICKKNGFIAMITMESWTSLSKFKKFREYMLGKISINSLIHMPYDGQGKTSLGISFGTTAFSLRNVKQNYNGQYMCIRYYENDEDGNPLNYPTVNERYVTCNMDSYYITDDLTISYWLSEQMRRLFKDEKTITAIAEPRQGLATSDNNRYLRLWFEVDRHNESFTTKSREEAKESGIKWFALTKGGEFRKWYGNNSYVVDWENDGASMKASVLRKYPYLNTPDFVVKNQSYYFRPGITWSTLTSSRISFRNCEPGFIMETKGSICYPNQEKYQPYLLAFLNSTVCEKFAAVLSPTFDLHEGPVGKIPFVFSHEYYEEIVDLVRENIALCKLDWDAHEYSWDFSVNPLVSQGSDMPTAWAKWEKICVDRHEKLKANEERLNRIFAQIYGLSSETPVEVEERFVTIPFADKGNSVRELIQYAVGCMFGRYSLSEEGLIYAGGEWNPSRYSAFQPDYDAIIPICDDEYFEDDIVGRFVSFIEIVFGKEALEENLRFIASALGGKGSSRDIIRNYFINDFYADHCSTYSVTGSGKRPIYWLFDSGKKNGFKCLIYMHRYQPDTIARIRTDYVHEQQSRYRTAIADLEQRINGASTSERVKLSKQLSTLQAQAEEIRVYEEKIHHLADQMIQIDLDDGVKHNYEIFKDVLAKIK